MTKTRYIEWMAATNPAEREKFLLAADLPGTLAEASERAHASGGYLILLASVEIFGPSVPPTVNAMMSLMEVAGEWIPFIVVRAGYSDQTFQHECAHVTQFFDNPTIRTYMIEAQAEPPETSKALAQYAKNQFIGRALCEVEVRKDIDGHPKEAAIFYAMHDAVSALGNLVAYGMEFDNQFIATARATILGAAKTVAESPYFSGSDVVALIRNMLKRMAIGERGQVLWADLNNLSLNAWIEKNK